MAEGDHTLSAHQYSWLQNIHCSNWKDGRRGGGVAVFVQHGLPCVTLSALENANVETVWLLYRRPQMPRTISRVVVGAVYHPPAGDESVMMTHNILD